jgi:hypothetical protein
MFACFAGDHLLKTIAIAALSFISGFNPAMELRYQEPFFLVDVMSLCSLRQVACAAIYWVRACFSSPGHDER